MKKVWFITGSSRGLGRKITEVALANGDLVAATALGKDDLNDVAEKYKDVFLIKLNVTDKSQIENTIEETVKHFGRIDVLVNNAGSTSGHLVKEFKA
jgi:NAD(P)-dependent dehydrogenase (short-subunit alcohol dehydrogenase family)